MEGSLLVHYFLILESLENMRVLLQPLWGARIDTEIRIAHFKSAILGRCRYLRTSMASASVCASSCERGMLQDILTSTVVVIGIFKLKGVPVGPKARKVFKGFRGGIPLFETISSTVDIIGLENKIWKVDITGLERPLGNVAWLTLQR